MKLKPKITIADHFTEIEDPRVERTRQHKLIDIITIAICAVICGAEGWTDIEREQVKFAEQMNYLTNEVK